jgi:nitrate reductase gamma subunit
MTQLDQILFGYFPYVALTVLVVGIGYRFEREQYTWQASSSQMLRTKRGFNLASNLFHFGILGLVGGHVAGLLVPPAIYHALGVSDAAHQMMELVMGSLTGVMTLVGLSWLLVRRITDERIQKTGSAGDLLIALLLWLTLVVGLATLPFSYETRHTGEYLHALSKWAQAIVTLDSGAAAAIAGVPWMFKVHVLLGLSVFLVFPFTRLVHVCSAPLGYVLRRHTQIVRARQAQGRSA